MNRARCVRPRKDKTARSHDAVALLQRSGIASRALFEFVQAGMSG